MSDSSSRWPWRHLFTDRNLVTEQELTDVSDPGNTPLASPYRYGTPSLQSRSRSRSPSPQPGTSSPRSPSPIVELRRSGRLKKAQKNSSVGTSSSTSKKKKSKKKSKRRTSLSSVSSTRSISPPPSPAPQQQQQQQQPLYKMQHVVDGNLITFVSDRPFVNNRLPKRGCQYLLQSCTQRILTPREKKDRDAVVNIRRRN